MNNHFIINDERQNRRGEIVRENQPRQKRGRKNQENKNSRKSVGFKLSWDLDARLGHYVANRELKEHRHIDRSEVVEQVLDEFLTKEGY